MANYDFGPFHYDPEQRVLFRDGNVVSLAPKAIDTLHVLLERRGRAIEKAELMKLVWPDTTVEEIGLARNISILRKALETEGRVTYIETLPRRGYRFLAETREDFDTVENQTKRRIPRWVTWAVTTTLSLATLAAIIYWQFYVPSKYLIRHPGVASLAVVPFEPLTQRSENALFARGLSDLLVADLANAGGIEVLSPSTVRRHQRFGVSMGFMGRLLGVDVLLEGTTQLAGDQVEIASRLVDVHTGKVIWAENFARSASSDAGEADVAQEMANRIARQLNPPAR